jgi:hypothetical protein
MLKSLGMKLPKLAFGFMLIDTGTTLTVVDAQWARSMELLAVGTTALHGQAYGRTHHAVNVYELSLHPQ